MSGRSWTAAAAVVAACAALAFRAPARSDDDPWSAESVRARFPHPDATAAAGDYAGNAECKECHEDRLKSLATSFHAELRSEKKSGSRGCEACHGPARRHVDDAGDPPVRNPNVVPDRLFGATPPPPQPRPGEEPRAQTPVSVKEMNGVCVACHAEVLTKPVLGHREWIGRARAPATERSCVSCHSVHVEKKDKAFDESVGPFAAIADLEKEATYTDPSACASCHVTFHPAMARSGHAALLKDGPEHGCGACHGPGSLHAASGGDARKILRPDELPPKAADAVCNACHQGRGATQKWTCAEHAREGVTCVTCHDANAPAAKTLRAPEFELCGSCHLDVKAKFRLANRHRVAEGRIECSDCHDPHGNVDKVRDQDLRYRACARCHQEKAGPFLYDHGIKRGEGCTACHEPHGSSRRRMLTFQRIQPMCLQCHPEVPHDLRDRTYDNCVDCHVEIHGSDLDRYFRR